MFMEENTRSGYTVVNYSEEESRAAQGRQHRRTPYGTTKSSKRMGADDRDLESFVNELLSGQLELTAVSFKT